MKDRIRKFTWTQWVGMVCELFFGLLLLLMAIMWSIDMAKGLAFFTDYDGNALMAYEWVVMAIFYILAVCLFGILVFEFFFMELGKEKKEAPDREMIDGKIVEMKTHKTDKK